jgi:cephalosporin-C deacetylase-like acetyl esterase
MKAKDLSPTVLLVVLFWSFNAAAQETAAQRHAMATNQLKQLCAEMSARCLADVSGLADWKKQRTELRRQLLEMLGLDPLPQRTPLKAQVTGRLDRDAYRIEKLVFQSMPGLYVTGNFYVPKGAKSLPTILYLCGHSPHPLGAKFNYQDRALWFVTHGYPCLVLDTLEFGEVAGIHHGTHNLNMWNWFSLGYTPAGVEVWSAMRALDYLETRPEVDKRRVGLSGISGGGAMTWYTAAVDERIAAAAPVCSTITYGSQAAHWLAAGQCDCIYYNNTYSWDFPIVGALIAPRPLLILSGQKDTIFPPDGYHEAYQRAKKVYDLYGNSDRIREVDDNVGHSDPPLFLREARQWMQRWLKDDPTPLSEDANTPPQESAEDLACLKQLPSDAINYKVQNQFVPRLSITKQRRELMAALKDKVFRWFPTETIPFETKVTKSTGGYIAKYADYKELSFQTEPGVRIRAQLVTPKQRRDAPLLLYVKRAGDSIYAADTDELLPVIGRHTVMILQPRFTEASLSAAEYTDIERTAVWVGRTIAAMQVWDVLRAVRWVNEEEKLPYSSLAVYGKGDMGIVAMYAALFDDRIKQIVVNDPPASHWERPALLNVLRITDIPAVADALAPRRLISVTKLPEPLAKRFARSDSLPEALEVWKQ